MKECGTIRMDEMGRIVVPKEMRKVLKLDEKNLVELYIERDKLIIKKYSPLASTTCFSARICDTMSDILGCICMVTDTSKVLAVSGEALKEAEGKKISKELYSVVTGGTPALINAIDGGRPISPVADYDFEYFSLAALPIEEDGAPVGSIALFGIDKECKFTDCEIKLLKLARKLIQGLLEDEK